MKEDPPWIVVGLTALIAWAPVSRGYADTEADDVCEPSAVGYGSRPFRYSTAA